MALNEREKVVKRKISNSLFSKQSVLDFNFIDPDGNIENTMKHKTSAFHK
jgi:hypothetical protein